MLGATARLFLFRFGIEARLSQAPIYAKEHILLLHPPILMHARQIA